MSELTSAAPVALDSSDIIPIREGNAAGLKQVTVGNLAAFVAALYPNTPGAGGGGSGGTGGSGGEVLPGTPTSEYPSASVYRIRTSSPGSDNVSGGWGEIEFADSEGVAIPATGGTSSASSSLSGYPAADAFDGDESAGNGWQPDTGEDVLGSWIQYEFDIDQPVAKIGLSIIGGAPEKAPRVFVVEYLDGSDWIGLGAFSANWSTANKKWFNLVPLVTESALARAKRWRVQTTTAGTSGGASWGYVAFFDRFDGPLGFSGTASASSEEGGFPASAAFDSNFVADNGWKATAPDAATSWVEFEFSIPQEVASVKVAPIKGTGYAVNTPTAFTLQFWDGSAWQDVGDKTASWVDNQGPAEFGVADAPDGTVPPPAPSDDAPVDGTGYVRKDGVWAPESSGASALADLTDVDLTGLADGDSLIWDATAEQWIPGGGAIESFLDIEDVPDSYTGQAGKAAVVNETEDGMEFLDIGFTAVAISQVDYDALPTPADNVLYCIPEA